ncbi:MAG: hypothetical protein DRN13_00400 [Thermoplasmata archaeon]|nr:MAG: hypothetical protein DRN13_00400 [Thermoplasmata archaeon]
MSIDRTGVYALVALIVIASLTIGLYIYRDDIERLLSPKVVEIGDCVLVNFIARYAENGTVFDTSYEEIARKSGIYDENKSYEPLKIFVDLNYSSPPEGYENFSSDYIRGLLKGLVGMKEGEEKILTIPPEEGYGIKPRIGTIINASILPFPLEVVSVKENVTMPEPYREYYGNITTTIYILRIANLKEGEVVPDLLNPYPCWRNSSVITKLNETNMWIYINPTTDRNESFTFSYYDTRNGTLISFPKNKSLIKNITEDRIIVEVNPDINDTITISMGFLGYEYKVENISADKINASYTQPDGNKSYRDFDRVFEIERNQTVIIAENYPEEVLRDALSYFKFFDPAFPYSLHDLADKTLIYEVKVEKIYKTSKRD